MLRYNFHHYQGTHPEFFTDFDCGTSGKLKGSEQIRRCNFSIKLTTLVEAGDLTGYYAEVTRELDRQTRWVALGESARPTRYISLKPSACGKLVCTIIPKHH